MNHRDVLTTTSFQFEPWNLASVDKNWLPEKGADDIKKDWDNYEFHKLVKVQVVYKNFRLNFVEMAGDVVIGEAGGNIPTLQILDPIDINQIMAMLNGHILSHCDQMHLETAVYKICLLLFQAM